MLPASSKSTPDGHWTVFVKATRAQLKNISKGVCFCWSFKGLEPLICGKQGRSYPSINYDGVNFLMQKYMEKVRFYDTHSYFPHFLHSTSILPSPIPFRCSILQENDIHYHFHYSKSHQSLFSNLLIIKAFSQEITITIYLKLIKRILPLT